AIVVEPTARRRQKLAANEAVEAMTTHLRAQIARRRASPGDDLLSELLGADEAGDALSEDELVSQLVLMFLAGHETTTNLVGNGMLALARHPDALAQLRAEPTRTPAAVEEMLRYDGPTNTNGRVTHADIDVGGTTIPEGSLLMCMLGAANRDPAVFAEPDRFDVARAPNPHTSFGGGVHFCVGAPLARLEAQVAIDQILRRFSRIDVHEPDVLWRDLVNLRGLASLPLDVTWADRDAR
ncbi:MAG: cytochrome P450, partial [Polyangiales bacterium]